MTGIELIQPGDLWFISNRLSKVYRSLGRIWHPLSLYRPPVVLLSMLTSVYFHTYTKNNELMLG